MDISINGKKERFGALGPALASGLVLGGLVGILIDKLIILAGGGMVLGLAIATAIESKRTQV
jgi:hypothetical protein